MLTPCRCKCVAPAAEEANKEFAPAGQQTQSQNLPEHSWLWSLGFNVTHQLVNIITTPDHKSCHHFFPGSQQSFAGQGKNASGDLAHAGGI